MFKVYDKDAGTYMDLREIMDIDPDEFANNQEIQKILSYMNESNPV